MQACLYSLENKVPVIAFSKDRCLSLFDHPHVDSMHTVYHEPKVLKDSCFITLISILLLPEVYLFFFFPSFHIWFTWKVFTGGDHAFSWASLGCCWHTGMILKKAKLLLHPHHLKKIKKKGVGDLLKETYVHCIKFF